MPMAARPPMTTLAPPLYTLAPPSMAPVTPNAASVIAAASTCSPTQCSQSGQEHRDRQVQCFNGAQTGKCTVHEVLSGLAVECASSPCSRSYRRELVTLGSPAFIVACIRTPPALVHDGTAAIMTCQLAFSNYVTGMPCLS
jgi:hypothetical protein